MKANELMIGDIVTFKDSFAGDAIPISVEIVGIGYQHKGKEEECLVCINGDETCDIIEIDDEVVGIPITSDILEKNGFKKEKRKSGEYEWWLTDDYYDVLVYEWSDSIWVFRYDCCEMNLPHTQATLSYVHELQRAFRLCGIDKEIVL